MRCLSYLVVLVWHSVVRSGFTFDQYCWGAFLKLLSLAKIRSLNKPHEVKFSNTILDKNCNFSCSGTYLAQPTGFVDTIIVIGGASTHYSGALHVAFMIGALLGDFVWLFGLTLISRTYAEKLNRPGVWLIIDISTIILVAYVLIKMIFFFA